MNTKPESVKPDASVEAKGQAAIVLHPLVRRRQDFKYDLEDKVKLTEINRPGIVNGMSVDNLGVQYRVCYWSDGARKQEWVYEHEIQSDQAV
jgi:hypothetical protein